MNLFMKRTFYEPLQDSLSKSISSLLMNKKGVPASFKWKTEFLLHILAFDVKAFRGDYYLCGECFSRLSCFLRLKHDLNKNAPC